MSENKFYSPAQAAMGAFLGGPLASTYFIHQNFKTMNDENGQSQSLMIGLLCSLLMLAILPFLPDNFPSIIIPVITIVSTRLVVEKRQFTKEKIETTDELSFHSNWRVFGVGMASLLLMLVIIVIEVSLLEM